MKIEDTIKTYLCVNCDKKETIQHINTIIEPYLCINCWLEEIKKK